MFFFIRLSFLFMALAITSFAMEKVETTIIKMGPLLRFLGQPETSWRVSVLYIVKSGFLARYDKAFAYIDKNQNHYVDGEIIGSKFGYDFVKFILEIPQSREEKRVFYRLTQEPNEHYFFVPAIGQSPTILYHSCNGYQSNEDKETVGGIQPMWQKINDRHHKKAFHIQIAGGDQLYADGIIDENTGHCHAPKIGEIYGVFSLLSLQEWLKFKNHHEALNGMAFSETMENDVDKFYFNHYVKQFNEPDFKEAMGSIPSLSQPDDHDFFDGCGSYPDYLQNSLVMSGIRRIATWYCFTIQHHANLEKLLPASNAYARSYNFLHQFNDGKFAILGVDTRSERTRTQVVSPQTWEEIFQSLEYIPANFEHLFVVLGTPVVFASAKKVVSALEYGENHRSAERILNCVFAKNIFGLFEIEDDLHDGWSHKDHKTERNWLINKLQNFAIRKRMRVTFFGGDVHVGGAGKIYHNDQNVDDNSPEALYQIISSPVGNVSTNALFAHVLGTMGSKPKKVSPLYKMHMIKLSRSDGKKERVIINRRNFTVINVVDRSLEIAWSAEPKPYNKNHDQEHRIYSLTIPAVEK